MHGWRTCICRPSHAPPTLIHCYHADKALVLASRATSGLWRPTKLMNNFAAHVRGVKTPRYVALRAVDFKRPKAT
jgi:hypothetical protein